MNCDYVVQHIHPNPRLISGARTELVHRIRGHVHQLEGISVLLSIHLLHMPPIQRTHLARLSLEVASFISANKEKSCSTTGNIYLTSSLNSPFERFRRKEYQVIRPDLQPVSLP